MKKIIITLLLLVLSSSIAFAKVTPEYTDTLKLLFKYSGTLEAYQTAVKQMLDMFKAQNPEIDSKIWADLEKEFLEVSLDDLIEMLAPVYERHLTISDLKEIIKFYQTPVGRKYAKETPAITQESMLVGAEWGNKIGQKFSERMNQLE